MDRSVDPRRLANGLQRGRAKVAVERAKKKRSRRDAFKEGVGGSWYGGEGVVWMRAGGVKWWCVKEFGVSKRDRMKGNWIWEKASDREFLKGGGPRQAQKGGLQAVSGELKKGWVGKQPRRTPGPSARCSINSLF